MKISELSKDELLGIIYNHLPDTLFDIHPCFCALCGKDYNGATVIVEGRSVKAISYICDSCEDDNKEKP